MSEVFKEYLIKQRKSPKDVLVQIGIGLAAIIIGGFIFVIGGDFVGPILICGLLYGAYLLFSKFNKEYEYILTNNELDIDVIYNRNSRKRVMTVNMRKIEIMASIQDKDHAQDINKGNKLINASDNANTKDTYAIIGQDDKFGAYKLLITPNEAFLQDLYKQSPLKVHKY